MVYRLITSPEIAHTLTKLKKKHGFYFRTLSATTGTTLVECEVTSPGRKFIEENNFKVQFLQTLLTT